ncbi:metal-sulfur cluster assembly factor, partial [Haloquadratum walsbyi]
MVSETAVRDRLEEVIDPCSAANGTELSIIQMGLLDEIDIKEDHVHIELMVTSPMCTMVSYFIKEIRSEVTELPEVNSVEVSSDNGLQWTQSMLTEEAQMKR